MHGIFRIFEQSDIALPELVKKVTLNPARAVGVDADYGAIEAGKMGDLLIVELLDGYPVITHVPIDGNTTSRVEYRR